MKKIDLMAVSQYVEDNIGTFHQKRISCLDNLSLSKVLKRKNPYLFRAKYVLTAEQIVKSLVDAHISSNEETIFGDWLEGLAVFINEQVYGGWKSGIANIDLEFDNEGRRYIVNIKSGPNWGNSSQIKKMETAFKKAKKTIRTSSSGLNVTAVNGCCYGKNRKTDKGDYFKYCGQDFWEFISGDENLYKELIIPIGHLAKEKNDQFLESYARMINKFTLEFSKGFCAENGDINWQKLVEYNSGRDS